MYWVRITAISSVCFLKAQIRATRGILLGCILQFLAWNCCSVLPRRWIYHCTWCWTDLSRYPWHLGCTGYKNHCPLELGLEHVPCHHDCAVVGLKTPQTTPCAWKETWPVSHGLNAATVAHGNSVCALLWGLLLAGLEKQATPPPFLVRSCCSRLKRRDLKAPALLLATGNCHWKQRRRENHSKALSAPQNTGFHKQNGCKVFFCYHSLANNPHVARAALLIVV